MAIKNTVRAIPVTAFDSAALTTPFQVFETLPESVFLIRLINQSSVAIFISYDGTNINDVVPATSVAELNFITSSLPSNASALMARNTTLYVSGTAGTGFIYVAAYYQPQS